MGELIEIRNLRVTENVWNAHENKTVIMYSVYMGAQLFWVGFNIDCMSHLTVMSCCWY